MDRLPFPEKAKEKFADSVGVSQASMDLGLSDMPIFQLLNTQSLLRRFETKPQQPPASKTITIAVQQPQRPNGNMLAWPGMALLPSLKERLPSTQSSALGENVRPIDLASGLTKLSISTSSVYEQFSRIFDHLTKDVSYSRDQLLSLNPGRRKLIEHRLEFIARKVARSRGERLTRGFSLTEVLRESYRDSTQNKLSSIAWRGFVSEVALYQMLELFFLKALDANGWRKFETSDLGRMNYCANLFLSQRAFGFAHDKHCWNFVRTNLYSWYVPSSATVHEITKLLETLSTSEVEWNDRSLLEWFSTLGPGLKPPYFDFESEQRLSKMLLDFVEKGLGAPLVGNFQGQRVCKKTFFPVLESGALAFSVLDRVLDRFSNESLFENPAPLQRAVWACEVESFESYWTEVLALLKLVTKMHPACPLTPRHEELDELAELSFDSMKKLPHSFHSVNVLGLELHNLDQLPLGSAEDATAAKPLYSNSFQGNLFQGSAAEIQKTENFDLSFVLDHADRTKSAKWMKAISDQLPYWGNLVGSSSNLNWGELHLSLALTKLRENGYCLYLSHRVLPEGGDGEKLRRSLLSVAALEAFIELGEETGSSYRYLYVFRRTSQKTERDRQRPRFGILKTAEINLSLFEEANSTQAEISERGWDHLFVRGAAPMVRHLNHKFPRLYQLATIQTVDASTAKAELELFHDNSAQRLPALEIQLQSDGKAQNVRFFQSGTLTSQGAHSAKALLFPHNTVDLPWLGCLLNSPPAQFWIRNHIQQNGHFKAAELKHCPIIDLSHAPADQVHESLDWLGKTKPERKALRDWALNDSPVVEKFSKFVALARRHSSLGRIVSRYRGLFTSDRFEDFRPEAVTQFYPAALLVPVTHLPEVRLQYVNRERTGLGPDHWIVEELHSVTSNSHGSSSSDGQGKPAAFTIVHTRQGPSIQMLMPMSLKDYVNAQLQQLKGHSWTEVLALLRVPSNVTLFTAQTTEIKRVLCSTAAELEDFDAVLNDLALELFEISAESRHLMLN